MLATGFPMVMPAQGFPMDPPLNLRPRSRTFPAADFVRQSWPASTPQNEKTHQIIVKELGNTVNPGNGLLLEEYKAHVEARLMDLGNTGPSADVKIISASSMLVADVQSPYRWCPGSPARVNGLLESPSHLILEPPLRQRHPRGSAVLSQAPPPPRQEQQSPDHAADDEDALFLAERTDPGSMRSAIWLAVIIGQVFSLMPISANPSHIPRFRYMSLRVLYWAFVTVGLGLNAVLSFMDMSISPDAHSITGTSRWVFYLSATTISVMYFRLAQRWRALCLCFLRVEEGCKTLRGGGPSLPAEWSGSIPGLRPRLHLVTILTLGLALAEYGLSQVSSVMRMDLDKYSFSNLNQFFRDRFMGNYPHMLLVGSYNPMVLLVTQFLNTTATFVWNYNDLFVMLISIIIAKRFRALNAKLSLDVRKERPEAYWQAARETYNALYFLTREVDNLIGSQILFSFMNNLYFICIQLLHTVEYENNSLLENIYFLYSFGFLLGRTVAVSLFAASINDESKNVKKVLYSVPSNSYCDEVDRFLYQVTSEEISLTGFKFFNVTRSFLLTMAGTIATYEIVMVQFSGNSQTP